MTLKDSIANLYVVFQSYPLNGRIHKCPCGCIPEEEEKKIYAKPFKELSADDLSFFLHKAMTTWGDLEHFKHFLPRIFELYATPQEKAWFDLEEIYYKMDYGQWKQWPELEQKAVQEFVLADWENMVNKKISMPSLSTIDTYIHYLPLKMLLENWHFKTNKIALNNFVHFFFYENAQLTKRRSKEQVELFLSFFLDQQLIDFLEQEFFEKEFKDVEYAAMVSTVHLLLEAEIKPK